MIFRGWSRTTVWDDWDQIEAANPLTKWPRADGKQILCSFADPSHLVSSLCARLLSLQSSTHVRAYSLTVPAFLGALKSFGETDRVGDVPGRVKSS